jgi:hypothetical protein
MIIETPQKAARRFSKPVLDDGFKPVALHVYTDESGEVLYWRIRCKHPVTKEKWIRPMWLSPAGYKLSEPEFPNGKPLYGLHRLVSNPDKEIWVVEGEKKADELNKLGLITTTSGGATSADSTDWGLLRGRTVRIWPDNDDPGKSYAKEVTGKLMGMGCIVSCIDVEKFGLGPKEDCVDWLEAHPNASSADIEALPNLTSQQEEDAAIQSKFKLAVQITCATDIKPKPIDWLWEGWLARGKLEVFAGMAGTGKTTIAISLAATISNGGSFPDNSRSPVGNVLIWSGEDSPEDTLVPRLIAAGADLSRVHFIGDVKDGDQIRSFDPAKDIAALNHAAEGIDNISMLIVDPIVNAVAGDSHKNGEVRRALQPLVDFGEKMSCAVLGISHFSKGTGGKEPLERVTGSLAFGALARIVLATAKITEGETSKRIFCRAKSNIGLDDGGFEYTLEQKEIEGCPGLSSSYVVWGEPVKGSARELLAEPEVENADGSNDHSVASWLQNLLKDEGGSLDRRDVMKAAHAMGYKERTVHRAREKIGVLAQPIGFGKAKRSIWSIVPIMPDKFTGTHGTHGTVSEDSDVWEV